MLIEFSVANWRSIKEKQTLMLVAAKGKERVDTNTFPPDGKAGTRLLRSAIVYGANASGKSSLIDALGFMQWMVTRSADKQRGDDIPVIPFRLDGQTERSPSEFEIVFVARDGVRYQYGFTATRERVHEEWLFAYPNGRVQNWLGRTWKTEIEDYQWEKYPALTGQKKMWQEATRPNALFLSTAVQFNSRQLQPVYDWFNKILRVVGSEGRSDWITARFCMQVGWREQVLDFLRAADLDIDDIRTKQKKMSIEDLPPELPEAIKKDVLARFKDGTFTVKTVRHTADGRQVTFELGEESAGTQKMFECAGPWLDTLANGYVLLADELLANLHPKLVEHLVGLFHDDRSNPNNAQLILTSHETSILTQDVFRRDQIWFCEKDEGRATQLYPLTDFHARKGRENLQARYLAGRYGALPYVKRPDGLVEDENKS